MKVVHPILRAHARRRAEAGFTLIELIIVMALIAILLAIAVPAYTGFTDRADISVAQANVRAVVPAVEQFFSDNQTYVGLDNPAGASIPGLAHYDPPTAAKVTIAASPAPSKTDFCIYSTAGNATYFKRGPGGDITKDPGPNITDCDTST
jgi:prepilin-type N-terminal cleavage/methylation domain-containing protein